jgi:hypothetical protein
MDEQFPKARQEAKRFAGHIGRALGNASPMTEIAIVSNTDAAISTHFIQATTRKGPIQVVGVPLNAVCPGMQIFVRKMTRDGLPFYVFDGFAPAALTVANTSRAITATTGVGPAAASSSIYGSGSVDPSSPLTTIPASPPASGWFWSFFFYMAALPPAGAPCVLLDMPKIDGSHNITEGFRITYDYLGHLNAYFYTWEGGGTVVGTGTMQVFAPHKVWFATFQIGNGLAVNGAQYSNMIISQLSAGLHPVAGNYGMFLLSDSEGLNAAPAGSWLSKITFGCNYVSGPLWPYNLSGFIPSKDSDIVTGTHTLGSGLTVYNRWLCSDGSTTLPDTGTANVDLQTLGTLLTLGPY